MGVTLHYRTALPVAPAVADAVLAELPRANDGARWIHLEPITLEVPDDGHLAGFSKLNLIPDPAEYAAAMKEPAVHTDVDRFLGELTRWSAEHGLIWEFAVDGTPIGRIVDGIDSDDVRGYLESMAGVADEVAAPPPLTTAENADRAVTDLIYGDDRPPDDDGFHPHLFRPE